MTLNFSGCCVVVIGVWCCIIVFWLINADRTGLLASSKLVGGCVCKLIFALLEVKVVLRLWWGCDNYE